MRLLNERLAHRGPDGEGEFHSPDGSVAFGSRRLSIVDVPHGNMPMSMQHGEHEYVIISNGEFFNHDALRQQLSPTYTFKTRSDTEVALAAYLQWGESCVDHLLGQFAFAVYDPQAKRVFFARDRLGIKPLYYGVFGGTLVLSSEPKGVLAYPGVARVPDKLALSTFMLGAMSMMGKCEPRGRSFFEGVHSLPPGSSATFDARGLTVQQYWDVTFPPQKSAEQVVGELRREVSRAVLEQVPQEVTYGVPLSGGLDSSTILSVAVEGGVAPVAAVSVRFAGQQNPDYEYAKLFAERLHVQLIAPELSGEELMSSVDAFVTALDRPSESTRNLGIFAMYHSLNSTGVKVALIGEGADEFNLGYYYTQPGFKDKGEECATSHGFRALMNSYVPAALRFFNPAFIDASALDAAINAQVQTYYETLSITDPLNRMQYFYAKQFLKGRLDIHDRLGMAHGIEPRVPFCDEEVLSVSLAGRPEDNLAGDTEKALLRAAFSDLPADIRERRKSPQPESASPSAYRALLAAFASAIEKADASAWDFFSKERALEMCEVGESYVSAFEQDSTAKPPQGFRMRHVFLFLTLIRWHHLYFARPSA